MTSGVLFPVKVGPSPALPILLSKTRGRRERRPLQDVELRVSDAEGYQAMAEIDEDAARKRGQRGPSRRTLGQRLRLPLMIGVPVLILGVVAFFVLTGGKFESTDDAYVQAARAAI